MTISETSIGDISIVALNGRLDASTAPQLSKSRAITEATRSIVIDLSNVEFLDSSGLGALVGIARNKKAAEADIVLSCMNDKVRKVFEITQAYKLFAIYDDTDAAAAHAGRKNIRP